MKLYYMPGALEELVLVSLTGAIYCNINHPYVVSKDYSGPYLAACSWYKRGMSIKSQVGNLKGYTFIGDV